MARSFSVLLILLVVLATFLSSVEGRKLLTSNTAESMNTISSSGTTATGNVPFLFARLVLNALPKGGGVPASTPSKKGHSSTIEEQLFARHLADIDRILVSVPSPGAGH